MEEERSPIMCINLQKKENTWEKLLDTSHLDLTSPSSRALAWIRILKVHDRYLLSLIVKETTDGINY